MKLNRLLLLLAIIVPVVSCIICLNALKEINEEGEKIDTSVTELTSENNGGMVEVPLSSESHEEPQGTTQTMGGVEYISMIGEPLSKIYTDASVAISVANVYKDADETSEIVATTTKYDVLTAAQKYPQGWSRVNTGKFSGWMRTENLTFPEGIPNLSDTSVVGKTGKITADPTLNIRVSGSLDAKVLTTVPKDTTFTILEVSNGWYKLTYASTTGWVSSEYVEVE